MATHRYIDGANRQLYPLMMYILDRGNIDLLKLGGPDAKDFLHRLSTQNFMVPLKQPTYGAFLDGQAKFISLFTAWETAGDIFLFIENEMLAETFAYLEKMHFSENLKIEKICTHCFEVRNAEPIVFQESAAAYNWGLHGVYIFGKLHSPHGITAQNISFEEYDALRASYGFPKPKVDLNSSHILIEANLENMIDRNKGCYPGQEVVEKIYTYGRMPKRIFKIEFKNTSASGLEKLKNKIPYALDINGENMGQLTSVYVTPKSAFGFATLKRQFYEKNKTLAFQLEKESIQFSWAQ